MGDAVIQVRGITENWRLRGAGIKRRNVAEACSALKSALSTLYVSATKSEKKTRAPLRVLRSFGGTRS